LAGPLSAFIAKAEFLRRASIQWGMEGATGVVLVALGCGWPPNSGSFFPITAPLGAALG
jgi:hypothetical protein